MSKEMGTGASIMRLSTGGVFDAVDQLAQAIKTLGEKYNLVIPGGALGNKFPLLQSAGISFVFIDPEHESYRIQGTSKLGIGKTGLDRISSAAGVRWDPNLCGQIDDGKNQNFVEYRAAGPVLQLDGTERMLHATKRIDLRAERGTPVETWGNDAQEIARVAAKDKNEKGESRDPWPQIIQARQHILGLAESKAKNRAIRSLGIRTAYEPAELARGFAVVRIQFTGRSEDPEIEYQVSMMIAERALSSASRLYGRRGIDRAETPMIHAARVVPPVVVQEELDEEPDPAAEAKPPAAAAAPAAAPTSAPCHEPAQPKNDPMLICGDQLPDGSWPRKPCSAYTLEELEKKIAAYEKKKPTWDKKWAAKNQIELDALYEWRDYRKLNKGKANPQAADDVIPF